MPPNPPSKAHGFAMRSMLHRDMQIFKSEKKNSWPPPLPNPGGAPDLISVIFNQSFINTILKLMHSVAKIELDNVLKSFSKLM